MLYLTAAVTGPLRLAGPKTYTIIKHDNARCSQKETELPIICRSACLVFCAPPWPQLFRSGIQVSQFGLAIACGIMVQLLHSIVLSNICLYMEIRAQDVEIGLQADGP